jgi:DNA-binding IclR family transcriptional regulator
VAQNGSSGRAGAAVKELASANYSAPALEKGLDILELLARSERGMTQTEIAVGLGRSIHEIYRMLNTLVKRSYIASAGDAYSITPWIYELAHMHPPTERLVQEATPIMQEVVNRLDQSCHVTLYSPGKQVVVAKTDAVGGMGFSVRLGAEVMVVQSASGLVLMAFQDAATRAIRIEQCAASLSRKARDELERQLDGVERAGFASIESTQFRGLHVVSYPVMNSHGHAGAALTVPFLERLDRDASGALEDVHRNLAEGARKLSRRLGGRLVDETLASA